jgi:predicted TIM-barrel fold metal-dependent hydrolase
MDDTVRVPSVNAAELPKISADAHVDEPHDLWYARMPESMRDSAPRRIQANDDGGWSLVVDGSAIGWSEMSADAAAVKEAERIGAASPDVRFDMMRTDGVNGEVIYPTIGLYVWNIEDPEVGAAACRVYNDWIIERLGGSNRIKLACMVPTWDVDTAIGEMQRLGDDEQCAALLLPLVGTPEWNMPEWEPLWRAAEEVGKPVVMHQGTGHDMIFYRGWGSATANLLATQSMAARATALLSCGGVLERCPSLQVVLVEVNAGWMAWTMSALDEYYQAHQHWSKPTLAELPSHYIRRQIHATFQQDAVAIHNIPLTGADCLLWGNDYPHPESTYPNSNKVLDEVLNGLPGEIAMQVVGGNAERLFGFAPEVRATRP